MKKTARPVNNLPPVHPGVILLEEFLLPLDISQNALARAIDVTPARVNEICKGKRAMSADTAARLARYFGTSAQFWLNLQANYDLKLERKAHRNYTYIKPFQPLAGASV